MQSPEAPRLLPSWQAGSVGDRRWRRPAEGGVDIGLVLVSKILKPVYNGDHDAKGKSPLLLKAEGRPSKVLVVVPGVGRTGGTRRLQACSYGSFKLELHTASRCF